MSFIKLYNKILNSNLVVVWVLVDVYERLIQTGKKPGFIQLLATQTVSAVWHVSKFYLHFKLIVFSIATVSWYLHHYCFELTIIANVCLVFLWNN